MSFGDSLLLGYSKAYAKGKMERILAVCAFGVSYSYFWFNNGYGCPSRIYDSF